MTTPNMPKRIPPPPQSLPCGTCTLCCRGERIFLFEEYGDDPSSLQTEVIMNPLLGVMQPALKQKKDRSCIYLGAKGCEAYEQRPAVCRSFSCAAFYMSKSKAQRRAQEAVIPGATEIFRQGRKMAIKTGMLK